MMYKVYYGHSPGATKKLPHTAIPSGVAVCVTLNHGDLDDTTTGKTTLAQASANLDSVGETDVEAQAMS